MLEIAGSPLVGLISESGTLADIAVALRNGSHRMEIERLGRKLVFRVNVRPVEGRATIRASDIMPGRIFLRLAAGNSCSIRKWALWTEEKPPLSGKP